VLDDRLSHVVGPPAQHDAQGQHGLRVLGTARADRGQHGVQHLLKKRASSLLDDDRERSLFLVT
jgi:hypothetical protein